MCGIAFVLVSTSAQMLRAARACLWLFTLIGLLAAPTAASAAPDLGGKQLDLEWRDPENKVKTHVSPGVFRTSRIVIEAGVPGKPVRASLLDPSTSDLEYCGEKASYIGDYKTDGTLQLRLKTPGRDPTLTCKGGYHHQLDLKVAGNGTVSGTWHLASAGWAWSVFVPVRPVSGRCVNCATHDSDWTTGMIAFAIAALLILLGRHLKQVKDARQAAASGGRPAAVTTSLGRSDHPSFEGIERTGASRATPPSKPDDGAAARAAREAEARRQADAAAAARRLAAERAAAADAARQKAERDAAAKSRRDAAAKAKRQAELEAERNRLHEGLVAIGRRLVSNVEDGERRRFYQELLGRHRDDPVALQRAIAAIAKQLEADSDRAVADAEWWGGFEKASADIRDWSMRFNRLLALGGGGGAVMAVQGAVQGAVAGAAEEGVKGAAKRALLSAADVGTRGMASTLYDADGNPIRAIAAKAAALDPREYARRLAAAKAKLDKGNIADAAGELIDTALDAHGAARDVKNVGHGMSRLGAAAGILKAKRDEPPKRPRNRQEIEAAELKWRQKAAGLKGTEPGNEFEKGFRGWDRDNMGVWVEDLDSSIKSALNPAGHTKFAGAETPLIDKRLYNRGGARKNQAGFVSVTASEDGKGPRRYVTKFSDLVKLPSQPKPSTNLLLKFLGYEQDPGAFVDRAALWIPKGHEAMARQAIGRMIYKNGAYDFTPFEDYVNHLRATRPDLDTSAKIARELVGKIQGRTPWEFDG